MISSIAATSGSLGMVNHYDDPLLDFVESYTFWFVLTIPFHRDFTVMHNILCASCWIVMTTSCKTSCAFSRFFSCDVHLCIATRFCWNGVNDKRGGYWRAVPQRPTLAYKYDTDIFPNSDFDFLPLRHKLNGLLSMYEPSCDFCCRNSLHAVSALSYFNLKRLISWNIIITFSYPIPVMFALKLRFPLVLLQYFG